MKRFKNFAKRATTVFLAIAIICTSTSFEQLSVKAAETEELVQVVAGEEVATGNATDVIGAPMEDAEVAPAAVTSDMTVKAIYEETYPEFNDSVTVDGVVISAHAEKGIIEAGASLSAVIVDLTTAQEEKVDEKSTLEDTSAKHAFDINIISKNGEKLQPVFGEEVQITFGNTEALDDVDAGEVAEVVYVADDASRAELMTPDTTNVTENVEFDAEHFSIYVVVATDIRNISGLTNIKDTTITLLKNETKAIYDDFEEEQVQPGGMSYGYCGCWKVNDSTIVECINIKFEDYYVYANITGLKAGTTDVTYYGFLTETSRDNFMNGGNYEANVTETFTVEVKENAAYTVKHFTKNLVDAGYTLVDTENLTGTTEASVTPGVKTYPGFTAPATQTVIIAANGTTEVSYYYTRNQYELTLFLGTGIDSIEGSGTYYFEEPVSVSANVANAYTFTSWTGTYTNTTSTFSLIMPAGSVELTANASANAVPPTPLPSGSTSSTSSYTPDPAPQSALVETKDYEGIIKTLTQAEKDLIVDREPVKVENISAVPTAKQLFIAAASLNRFDVPLTSSVAGTTPLRVTSAPADSTFRMGNAVQGPECMKTVFAHTAPGDVMLRSFSLGIYKAGKQLAPTEVGNTRANVSVVTADRTIETGYKYVLLCVESGGMVTEYEDTDNNPKTFSAEVKNFGAFFIVKRPVK